MSFVNFSTKEITSKIVYYGPGLCGKTTTLQYIYDSVVPENKGQIVSLATDVDRTIYFDFLPLKLGKIQNFSVRIQLYTVPGQVRYNSTRKLVLSGTDGVVFVADSQRDLMEENLKSFHNLVENLKEHGLSLKNLPHILQFNKRDLPGLAPVGELERALNPHGVPYFETCATSGEGVLEGLKMISKLVMADLNRKGVVRRKKSVGTARWRTDSMLRPVVGPPADGDESGATVVEEYTSPISVDEALAEAMLHEETPPGLRRVPLELHENEIDPALAALPTGPSERFPRVASHTLSFTSLFEDSSLSERVLALEERLSAGDFEQVRKRIKEVFYALVEDPRFFPPDMTESSRISMLGISLRKYAHFYRLLSQPSLGRSECLFLLHFLVDVHFGKGMP